jgi:hypothetical protein
MCCLIKLRTFLKSSLYRYNLWSHPWSLMVIHSLLKEDLIINCVPSQNFIGNISVIFHKKLVCGSYLCANILPALVTWPQIHKNTRIDPAINLLNFLDHCKWRYCWIVERMETKRPSWGFRVTTANMVQLVPDTSRNNVIQQICVKQSLRFCLFCGRIVLLSQYFVLVTNKKGTCSDLSATLLAKQNAWVKMCFVTMPGSSSVI